jgi:putative Holliday junction resolvase
LQPGRLLALDLGARRVGLAVSDELRITVRPLPALRRTNWKQFVRDVAELCKRFDARGLVVGLPLRLDGFEGDAAREAKRVAHNLELSLGIPIYLQDERLTTHDATQNLRAAGVAEKRISARLDSEAAAIILRDFILFSSER